MAERKSVLVRLSPELYADIRRLAELDLRSINGEIEFLLRQAVMKRLGRPPGEGAEAAFRARLNEPSDGVP